MSEMFDTEMKILSEQRLRESKEDVRVMDELSRLFAALRITDENRQRAAAVAPEIKSLVEQGRDKKLTFAQVYERVKPLLDQINSPINLQMNQPRQGHVIAPIVNGNNSVFVSTPPVQHIAAQYNATVSGSGITVVGPVTSMYNHPPK